jgi:hypothetical protein
MNRLRYIYNFFGHFGQFGHSVHKRLCLPFTRQARCAIFFVVRQSLEDQGLLFLTLLDHTHLNIPHSVRLLWTSDQPIATITTERHPCPPAGFEPAIPPSDRPQTHSLDRDVTWIGVVLLVRPGPILGAKQVRDFFISCHSSDIWERRRVHVEFL